MMSEFLANREQLEKLCASVCDEQAQRDESGVVPIRICMGASCIAAGARRVQDSLAEQLEIQGLGNKAEICEVGCLGPCSGGPVMVVGDVFYEQLRPQDCSTIVREHLGKGEVVDRLTHRRPDGRHVPQVSDIGFFRRQTKVVLNKCGQIDPQQIEQYIGQRGYQALAEVLERRDPESVLDELRKSGLRGRGGAGFPTWRKWDFTRKADGDEKYVVCNADEGDPGAFMDRSLLEGDPHVVMEGMAIAAATIGASRGFIYVRAEYPLAVERLETAIAQARRLGLLGTQYFGHRLRLRFGNSHGIRRVCLRRRNGAVDVDRRQPGRTTSAASLPGTTRLVGKTNSVEQRGNVCQRADHPVDGRQGVRKTRHSPRAEAPRSSHWPEPSRTRDWSKSRSACRWAI